MKKILLSIIILFIVSTLAIAAFHSDFVTYSLIKYSDFEEIQKDIFVSPDTSSKQRIQLIDQIKNAKDRIKRKFGSFTALPIIISTHNTKWRKKYSNNSYASTISLPFKDNKSYIFIGENGHDLDIISHELVHAEVFSHLGYLNQNLKIPIWFNEGIAMQVDYRKKYNTLPLNKKEINQLKYASQFFKGTNSELTAHYSIAKNEVQSWLDHKNNLSLNEFLKEINNGKDFNKLYTKMKH